MFGTMFEVEGGNERRWGNIVGVRLPNPRRRIAGFSGRRLHGFFDAEDDTIAASDAHETAHPDYLTAILDTLKAVAPAALGVVQAAVNRGVQTGASNSCPAGYAYYSPIVGRCFRTPQEMSAAETAVRSAQTQYGGGSSNMMLIAGAVGLGVLGLVLAMKK